MSVHHLPPPASPWPEGEPAGERQFLDIGAIDLERGGHLPDVTVAYETWGTLNAAADNAVLVEHALTGDSHVVGEAGPGHPTAGWWQGLIGTGAPLDTDRHFVVATNVLGGCRGTTGPSTADASAAAAAASSAARTAGSTADGSVPASFTASPSVYTPFSFSTVARMLMPSVPSCIFIPRPSNAGSKPLPVAVKMHSSASSMSAATAG